MVQSEQTCPKKIQNNNVPFDVGDVVTVLHCLESKMLLVLYMFQNFIVCIYVSSTALAWLKPLIC